MHRLEEEEQLRNKTSAAEQQASPRLRNFLYNPPVSLPHLLDPIVEAKYFDLKSIELMEPEDLVRVCRAL